MLIAVHVTPKAGRDEVAGWRGGELSLRVTAPPEAGRANAAVCSLIARELGLARSAVRVVRGQSSRHKHIEIEGAGASEIRAVFGEPPQELL